MKIHCTLAHRPRQFMTFKAFFLAGLPTVSIKHTHAFAKPVPGVRIKSCTVSKISANTVVPQSKWVNVINNIVGYKSIAGRICVARCFGGVQQIESYVFNGVSAKPPSNARMVNPVFVENQLSGIARALGRKAQAVQSGSRTCDADGLAKGAVFIAGSFSTSGGTEKGNNISVAVERAEMRPGSCSRGSVQDHPEQSTNLTRTVHRS